MAELLASDPLTACGNQEVAQAIGKLRNASDQANGVRQLLEPTHRYIEKVLDMVEWSVPLDRVGVYGEGAAIEVTGTLGPNGPAIRSGKMYQFQVQLVVGGDSSLWSKIQVGVTKP